MLQHHLKGLCHGCLVHWANAAYDASLFVKELDISQPFTSKRQNHNFVSNEYLSPSILSNVTNNKNET